MENIFDLWKYGTTYFSDHKQKQIFRFFFRTLEMILVDHSFPSAIDHSYKS